MCKFYIYPTVYAFAVAISMYIHMYIYIYVYTCIMCYLCIDKHILETKHMQCYYIHVHDMFESYSSIEDDNDLPK